MPISARMTASVLYVNENGVSPLLDFIIVRVPIEHEGALPSTFAVGSLERVYELGMLLLTSLRLYAWVPSSRYLKIGVIQVSPSSFITANISTSLMDFSFNSSTNTCLLKCAKLVEAILLSASNFLFSLLGTCLIENALKLFEDPSVNKIYGSESSSSTSIRVSEEPSFGRSTMKSANICPLIDTLETLAERLGLTESQPHVDQLIVPIHHSPDKVVVGATALSLSLDVSNIRVRKIRENIASQRSALRDVFVPLSEPFYAEVLIGAEGTSDIVSATDVTTTALSTTLAYASTVLPIYVDDYEVTGMDDQTGADGNADPFPNVDDGELNIP
nr:hypothetical protein [Tanacetum cinerariifolium]